MPVIKQFSVEFGHRRKRDDRVGRTNDSVRRNDGSPLSAARSEVSEHVAVPSRVPPAHPPVRRETDLSCPSRA